MSRSLQHQRERTRERRAYSSESRGYYTNEKKRAHFTTDIDKTGSSALFCHALSCHLDMPSIQLLITIGLPQHFPDYINIVDSLDWLIIVIYIFVLFINVLTVFAIEFSLFLELLINKYMLRLQVYPEMKKQLMWLGVIPLLSILGQLLIKCTIIIMDYD